MKKFLQKKLKNEKGLTLVELLAVIVILGIIAAIAVPAIGNIIENTKYNAVKADAINALNAANMYYSENTKTPEAGITVETLVEDGYLENKGKLTVAMTIAKSSEKKVTINGTSEEYAGGKTVTFNTATLDDINSDEQKGSKSGNKTLPAS
ncbi:type II secretion system protein [Sporosarcina sp. FSL W7-1283]|uniref:type II secretion system protein n=1 Tax=Sporosarcina sp. FSL W7-1283 TaxID=2921560 RepID=UPI0030F7ED19